RARMARPARPLRRGHDADLKQPRPELAGNEQPLALGVVGDAVEHVLLAGPLLRREDARHVDPAGDPARGRVDADDPVFAPDVREDLALDVLQLVEPAEGQVAALDLGRADDPTAVRLEEAQ